MWAAWTIRNHKSFSQAIQKIIAKAENGDRQLAFMSLENLITAALKSGDAKLKERKLYNCLSEAYAAQAGISRREGNDGNAEKLFLKARKYGALSGEAFSFLADRFITQGRNDDTAWEIFLGYCRTRDFMRKGQRRSSGAINYGTQDDRILEYLRNSYEITPETSPARYEELKKKNEEILNTGYRVPWNIFSIVYADVTRKYSASSNLEKCMFDIMGDPAADTERTDSTPSRWGDAKVKQKVQLPPEVRAQQADPQQKFYIARCLAGIDRHEEAFALLNTLGGGMGSWWLYHYVLGTVYFRLGQLEEASKRFEEAERKAGRRVAAVQIQLGHLSLQKGSMATAAEYYNNACECAPDDWRAFYWLGRAKMISGRLNEAIPNLEKATGLSKTPTTMIALGIAYEDNNDLVKASKQYDKCLELYSDPYSAYLYLRKGICFAKQGKRTNAISFFERTITEDEAIDDFIKKSGKKAAGQSGGQDLEKARRSAKIPESVADAARFYLGALYIEDNDFQQAIRAWRVIQSPYWSALARPHLIAALNMHAEIEFDKGQYSSAASLWADTLTYLDDNEEKAIINNNIIEAKFREISAGSAKTARPQKMQQLREAATKDQSTRGRYFSYLLALAEGKPDQCDFLGLAGVDNLDANRCQYHHALARAKQGFFEEQLLTELSRGNGEYGTHAREALLAGYLRSRRIPEALKLIDRTLAEEKENVKKDSDDTSSIVTAPPGITAKSYGVVLEDGKYQILIKAGTPYPMKKAKTIVYYTESDNQKTINLPIYCGDDLEDISHNDYYGDVFITLQSPVPKGTPIAIGFKLDRNQILDVSAEVKDKAHSPATATMQHSPVGKVFTNVIVKEVSKNATDEIKEMLKTVSVLTQSYGVEMEDGSYCVILKAGTAFPMKAPVTRMFYTETDGQKSLTKKIYRGDNLEAANKNEYRGSIIVTPLNPLPKGTPYEIGLQLSQIGFHPIGLQPNQIGLPLDYNRILTVFINVNNNEHAHASAIFDPFSDSVLLEVEKVNLGTYKPVNPGIYLNKANPDIDLNNLLKKLRKK